MNVPFFSEGWTEAMPLLVSAPQAVVYLALGGMLGGIMAALAHLAWRDGGSEAWRRLRFVGTVLAAVQIARLALHGATLDLQAVLAAALSLLDLALLALAVGAVIQLWQRRAQRRGKIILYGLLAQAVFLGLLGGDASESLLARNLPAAAAHLGILATVVALMARAFAGRLSRQAVQFLDRTEQLTGQADGLRAELAALRGEHAEALVSADRNNELAGEATRRSRLLEHLLAGTVDLQARRDQQDLHECAVGLVRSLFGFDEVVLYQWAPTLEVFEAQAAVGPGAEQARPQGASHLDRAEYDHLVHPRFRISESYLVPPRARTHERAASAGVVAWDEGQRLVVPMIDAAGQCHGFFDLSRPDSGQVPDLLRIRYLELLARQVATILEVLDMRQRLAACRADLAQASERLQALGDLRNNFVANVSHELRTPLTSIIGYAEMLRERGEDMTPDMRREFVDVIHQQGLQFKEIINDLLDLDNIEDSAARQERTEFDLAALMRRQAEEWRQRAATADLTLTAETNAPSVVLEADPVLCQQLLNHLVDNALKFTPAGGAVGVRLSEQGTAVRLEVEDSGIGIPEEKLHTIFEQFYQVDASSTREVGGQGVGLSICQDIVSWHDGRIWAENLPGGGTRLTVLLPRRPHVVTPDPPASVHLVFHEPRLFLQRLIHWIGENLGVRSAQLLVADSSAHHLTVLAATGLTAGQVQDLHLAEGVGLVGQVWRDGLTRLEVPEPGDVLLTGQTPVLCVPLSDDDRTIGVVAVRDRLDGRPLTDDDRLLLESMAPRLVHLLARYDQYDDLARDFAAIQSSLRVTTRVGTLPHADVAAICQEICLATARRLGLPESDTRHLAFALQYYDVGLGCVPPYLLNKTERLSEAERTLLERHVKVGLTTLAPLQPPPKVRQIILHHHENYDGSGYPKGLMGEAIPLGSRLIALSDSLRALLQRRPWRPAVPLPEALAEIQALAGTRYCPRLAAVFLEEAGRRRRQIDDLRQRADDGEDLKRPAPPHPMHLVRS